MAELSTVVLGLGFVLVVIGTALMVAARFGLPQGRMAAGKATSRRRNLPARHPEAPVSVTIAVNLGYAFGGIVVRQ